jgi:outer membrane lipoprotein-sorting protein
MKQMITVVLGLAVLVVVQPFDDVTAQEQLTAYGIMEHWDNRTVPIDLTCTTTMNLIDKKGKSRTRLLKTWRMSDDKQLMWFLQPADVKGSSFLRLSYDDRDDDMWMYLPAFGKVRRIASHAKKGSFMGTDFTFEDLGDRKLRDYSYQLLGEEEIDGHSCWIIESVPNEGVATDYSKIVSWIWKEDYLDIREEFYDKKGNLKKAKTLEAQKVEQYWVPNLIVMENLESKHRTELVFEDIEVDTGLDDNMFKSNYMTRIH